MHVACEEIVTLSLPQVVFPLVSNSERVEKPEPVGHGSPALAG